MTTLTRTCLVGFLFSTLSFAGLFPAQEGDLSSDVRFSFAVNGKTMQAGGYIIRADSTSGRLDICEDGVYCQTVQAAFVRPGKEVQARIVFRQDGASFQLSHIITPDGTRYELPAEPEPMILPSGDDAEEFTKVEAKPLCIHNHGGSGLAKAWH